EEVIETVEAVALGVIAERAGIGVVEDSQQAVFTQTHKPGEDEGGVGLEGRLGESVAQRLDDGLESVYVGPHGEPPCSWDCQHSKGMRNPLSCRGIASK